MATIPIVCILLRGQERRTCHVGSILRIDAMSEPDGAAQPDDEFEPGESNAAAAPQRVSLLDRRKQYLDRRDSREDRRALSLIGKDLAGLDVPTAVGGVSAEGQPAEVIEPGGNDAV